MKLFEETITDFSKSQEDIEEYIKYFKRRKIDYTEDVLIKTIKNSKVKNEIFFSILALRNIGTDKSIPILKKSCFYKNQDSQSNSILTINQIAKETETEFYGNCLLDARYKQKGYALWALVANSNGNAIEQVTEFLQKQLKKQDDNMGYISTSICYLNRYKDYEPEINKIFEKVKKRFSKFNSNTQKYIESLEKI